MPTLRTKPLSHFREDCAYLAKFASNVYSQTGEDGILPEIFRIIGEENKWCVEFGAWDGVHLSNTCNLIRNSGWKAVMIEGDPDRIQQLKVNHPDRSQVIAMHRWVGFTPGKDTIDDILADTPIPIDFDLLSIDIDGMDWYIWDSIKIYRPRVVIIEFNSHVPNEVVFIQDKDPALNEGCSIAALEELAKEKGYELVCIHGGNGIFVRKELFPLFKIPDNSIYALRVNPANFVFDCYNGKIYNTLKKLGWAGKRHGFGADSLQFLDRYSMGNRIQGTAPPRVSLS